LGLAALLGGFVGEAQADIAWPAVGIASLALVLDGVDGWLARRGGWESAFGARFDMETDALLLLLMTCLIWQLGKAGPWVLLSGAMRYLFLAAATAAPSFRRPLPASQRRRTICVLQIISLLVALLPTVPAPWSEGAAAAGLALLCYSFGADSAWLLSQSRHKCEEPPVDDTPR
jgi:phosphatidylglycerophosphate synthase